MLDQTLLQTLPERRNALVSDAGSLHQSMVIVFSVKWNWGAVFRCQSIKSVLWSQKLKLKETQQLLPHIFYIDFGVVRPRIPMLFLLESLQSHCKADMPEDKGKLIKTVQPAESWNRRFFECPESCRTINQWSWWNFACNHSSSIRAICPGFDCPLNDKVVNCLRRFGCNKLIIQTSFKWKRFFYH